MIVTLTANPAIDRTVELRDALHRGGVHRAASVRDQAGGKGINVARALAASDVASLAVFPAAPGDPLAAAVRSERLAHRVSAIAGAVRTNLAITEPDGTTTKVNEPGPTLDRAEVDALVEAAVDASAGADWLVLAGSLPPGAPGDLYARVIGAVRGRYGADAPRVAIDSSGDALREALESGQPVELIKPNADELAELVAHRLDRALTGADLEADPGLAATAGRLALSLGVGAVLLTLGAAGALYLDAGTALLASPPPIGVASTVGAGDASLAGYLLAHGEGATPATALAQAVAHGAAAAALPGSSLPARADTHPESVRVRPIAGPHEAEPHEEGVSS